MLVLEGEREKPGDAHEGTKNQNQSLCTKRNDAEAKEECKKGVGRQRNNIIHIR